MPAGPGNRVGPPPELGGGAGSTPQIKELVVSWVSTRRIMLQRDMVLPARCQADLIAQMV